MLGGIFDNAAEVELRELENELTKILLEGEKIIKGFTLARNFFVFTERRLILLDIQGFKGKKKKYHSLPYKSITHFSVETAGSLDRYGEIKIWILGDPTPIRCIFKHHEGLIFGVQKILAHHVMN
ncbi:MAG: PH domain-containing protein [Leptolyngbya sp. SIO3F4]|nr:PH domain-containing protein [Leptolyngbya sp. SIO3F4]